MLLKQAKDMIRRSINESPTTITLTVYPTKDNSFGEQVPDLDAAGTEISRVVRISHESGVVSKFQTYDAGLDSNNGLFLLADHTFDGIEGQTFTYDSRTWRIGNLDTLRKFGGVYGYIGQLIQG